MLCFFFIPLRKVVPFFIPYISSTAKERRIPATAATAAAAAQAIHIWTQSDTYFIDACCFRARLFARLCAHFRLSLCHTYTHTQQITFRKSILILKFTRTQYDIYVLIHYGYGSEGKKIAMCNIRNAFGLWLESENAGVEQVRLANATSFSSLFFLLRCCCFHNFFSSFEPEKEKRSRVVQNSYS